MKELDDIAATQNNQMTATFEELMSKTARLRHGVATSVEDILGWDYVTREGITCYSFYAAQPPLIGMSTPVPIVCPLGIRAFGGYKIDAAAAIEKFHTLNCGNGFVAMTLYWPLSPAVEEPEWHIRSELGCNIVIGANSGKIAADDPSNKHQFDPHIVMLYMAPPPEAN
jgi:hypothetical protein